MRPVVMAVACLLLQVPASAQDAARVRITRTSTVNELPDGGASVVATVNAGEVLDVLDERAGWLLVRPAAGPTLSWKTGWVNAANTEALSQSPDQSPTPPLPQDRPARGRKGFIIGLGGGFGMHRYTTPSFTFRGVTFGGESITSSGLATEFLIGYAPTDRLLIYYENSLQLTGDSRYDVLGLTGAGATYFFNPQARSWYVKGAIGAAVGAAVDINSNTVSSVDRGLAFSVGGGYEFARHWLLGGDAMFLELDDVTHTAIRGTITWVFY